MSVNAYVGGGTLWDIPTDKEWKLCKAYGVTNLHSWTETPCTESYSSFGFQRMFLL